MSFRTWLAESYNQMPWLDEMLDGQNGLVSLIQHLTKTVRHDSFIWEQFRKFQGAIANIRGAQQRGSEVAVLEKLHDIQDSFHAIFNDLNDRSRKPQNPYPYPQQTGMILKRILGLINSTFDAQTKRPADSGAFPASHPEPRHAGARQPVIGH